MKKCFSKKSMTFPRSGRKKVKGNTSLRGSAKQFHKIRTSCLGKIASFLAMTIRLLATNGVEFTL
jgi:hypothetical protein